MQAVKHLVDLSATTMQDSSTATLLTAASAPTTTPMKQKHAEEDRSVSDTAKPEPEPQSGQHTLKPLTVEEEWVLVATCAAFLSKSCLGNAVCVKTRPVNMSGADGEWLLVETAPTAHEPSLATESM